jgi:hypothetical protein
VVLKYLLNLADGLSCALFIYHITCWCWYPEVGTSSMDLALLSRFHLKTETESNLRNVEFQIKDRTMDNVQNCGSYINIPSSQTFRYH